jgi:Asp-tRNA(Asn)/Glu-tRNA(Gln) amidotransferase A subunit family amidase
MSQAGSPESRRRESSAPGPSWWWDRDAKWRSAEGRWLTNRPSRRSWNSRVACAASIPAGMRDGLPVGLQLIGRRYADADVLAASAALERLRPWRDTYRTPAERQQPGS